MNSPRYWPARAALVRTALVVATVFASLSLSAAEPQGKKSGAKYALLVGVHQYDKNELRSLPYTEADVTALAEVLSHADYAPENVVLMTQTRGAQRSSELPLAANIRKQLKLLLDNCDEGDSVLIALAGHGVQFKNSEEAFFCPMDARLNDKRTLISFTELYADLEKSKADFKLVLADACRNDPRSENARSRAEVDLESVTRPQKTPPPGGVAVFFSCSATERAFEHDELKHGVFFNFVIEGLKGKAAAADSGEVTLNDLDSYVTRHVKDFVRSEYQERQVPEMLSKVRDLPVLVRLARDKPRADSTDLASLSARKPTVQEKPGDVTTNSLGMKLAYIPAGEFSMGTPESEIYIDGKHDADATLHRVRISKPFYLGVYAVTQEEFETVMGENPSAFCAVGRSNSNVKGLDTKRLPVESVSWSEAQKFCAALGKRENQQYRLPTEAEWEYACRAGTATPFYLGATLTEADAKISPYDCSDPRWAEAIKTDHPSVVGAHKPNAWGLYDMHGNVWQWCQDWYDKDYYSKSPAADPAGPPEGYARSLRGGGYFMNAYFCRSGNRYYEVSSTRRRDVGFRVVLCR